MNSIYLSVVIPAFNESKRLPQTLDEIRTYLDAQGFGYEVIVADDGSRDTTVEICRRYAEAWPSLLCLAGRHRGKGSAVKRACLAARGEIVLVMDADHATPIDSLDLFLPLIEVSDAVVGVRTYCGEEGSSGKFRRILGLIQQLLAHLIVFDQSVADSQCGFKLFTRDCARLLFSRCRVNGGMFDAEIFLIAQKHKLRIFSQPVKWVNKTGSTIQIVRCILLDPLSLICIRIFDWLGKYR